MSWRQTAVFISFFELNSDVPEQSVKIAVVHSVPIGNMAVI